VGVGWDWMEVCVVFGGGMFVAGGGVWGGGGVCARKGALWLCLKTPKNHILMAPKVFTLFLDRFDP